MEIQEFPLRFRHVIWNFVRFVVSTSVVLAAPCAMAQGVPHLSVNPSSYHTLIPPHTFATAAVCQTGDSYCLAHAVGQQIFASGQVFASDKAGNIYVYVYNSGLYKITPDGQYTLIAGQFGNTLGTDPPLTMPAHSAIGFVDAMAVDAAGNIFVDTQYNELGSVLKIDTTGVIHRITATKSGGTAAPIEGALASTQYVHASSLSTDAAGDLYMSDVLTGTVRVLSAKTGNLNTVVGCLAPGCAATGPVVSGTKATLYNIAGGVAVAASGTLYVTGGEGLYSVTTDGNLHILATGAGPDQPVTPPGNIGSPGTPVVDAAENVYFASYVSTTFAPDGDLLTTTGLDELTKGTSTSPSQLLILATGPTGEPPQSIPTTNPEGIPSTLALDLPSSFTLDPSGRLIMSTQETPYGVTVDAGFGLYQGFSSGIAYFDRNGSLAFNTNSLPQSPATASQTITLTNSGSAPLKTVNIANTGFPYYLQPTEAQIEAFGAKGDPPFSIDQTTGTCLAKFAPTRVLTLQPGESCTLAIKYTPNANIPQSGSFTLYTNDPRGPLTVNLAATSVFQSGAEYPDETFFATCYLVTISSTTLTPSTSVSSTGDFTISATVASNAGDPETFDYLGEFYGAMDNIPITPTGRIYAEVSNNVTGAVTTTPANTLDADGKTSFTFSHLAPGTYSLQGIYLGDGISAASFSGVQTLTVKPLE